MLKKETLEKLTTSLAADVDLYNEVLKEVTESDQKISQQQDDMKTLTKKLEDSESKGQQYLGQISNLLSKIPIGNSSSPLTYEQKMEEIKTRKWEK